MKQFLNFFLQHPLQKQWLWGSIESKQPVAPPKACPKDQDCRQKKLPRVFHDFLDCTSCTDCLDVETPEENKRHKERPCFF